MFPLYVNKIAGLFALSAVQLADQFGLRDSPLGWPDVDEHALVETD
jgi:hypothetical protein